MNSCIQVACKPRPEIDWPSLYLQVFGGPVLFFLVFLLSLFLLWKRR